ncbi:hypothetical protein QF019_001974 [Pseudomonas frederiksbergensis]
MAQSGKSVRLSLVALIQSLAKMPGFFVPAYLPSLNRPIPDQTSPTQTVL